MTERERLIELIQNAVDGCARNWAEVIADHLLANGVIVLDTSSVDVVTNREPIRTAFGMPLDELSDLIRAKQQGNLIVPPCKVGDTVYKITRNKVKKCEVIFVGISADEKCSHFNFVENYADGTFYKSYSMVFDVIGKSVFLTGEEAEKALAGRSK